MNEVEDRTIGKITCKVFQAYVKTIGGYHYILLMVIFAFQNEALVMYGYKYLENWSKDFSDSPKYTNLAIYGTIFLPASLGGILRTAIEVILGYLLSTKMHSKMVRSLLHANLQSFHDRIPYGQIQNRFSRDLSLMDKQGIQYLSYFLNSMVMAIVQFSTISYSIGPEVFILLSLWLVYAWYLQKIFMNARREYRRLGAISKSPMIDCASDSIKGLAYLRSMRITYFMKTRFTLAVENVLKNELMDTILRSWFAARTSLMQQILIQLPCLLGILYYYQDLDSAKIGLFFLCMFEVGGRLTI